LKDRHPLIFERASNAWIRKKPLERDMRRMGAGVEVERPFSLLNEGPDYVELEATGMS
jgi:hypothetical protein